MKNEYKLSSDKAKAQLADALKYFTEQRAMKIDSRGKVNVTRKELHEFMSDVYGKHSSLQAITKNVAFKAKTRKGEIIRGVYALPTSKKILGSAVNTAVEQA